MTTKKGQARKTRTFGRSKGPPPNLMDFGYTGVKRSGRRLADEWHPDLRGGKAPKYFTEMLANSGIIGGAALIFETLVQQAPWGIEPHPADDDEAKRQAEWFEGARTDIDHPWTRFIGRAATCVFYGHAIEEILYKLRRGDHQDPLFRSQHNDGLWGWRGFRPRSQDSIDEWDLDDDDRARGFWQMVDGRPGRPYVPMSKCLQFVLRSRKESPEGDGALRSVVRPYAFATNLEEIEGVGAERHVAGMPLIRAPHRLFAAGAPADEQDQLHDLWALAAKVRQDQTAGLVFPGKVDEHGKESAWDFELLSPGKNVAEADPLIRRHHAQIGIGLLSQFLLLGVAQKGSWALSSDQTDLLSMAVGAVLAIISEAFNTKAIPDLARLNGFRMDRLPKLTFGDIERADAAKFSTALATLVNAQIVPKGPAVTRFAARELGWASLLRDLLRDPATAAAIASTAEKEEDEEPEPLLTKEQLASMMSLAEVAEKLGVGRGAVKALVQGGQLPAVRVGRTYRFNPKEVADYLGRVKVGAEQPPAAVEEDEP